jgi:hypothetical protein
MFCNEAPGSKNRPRESAYVKSGYGILRTDPLPSAPELDALPAGSKLRILDRTEKKIRIGSREDYWYRLQTADDLIGWMYGASITFSESDLKGDGAEAPAMDVSTLEKAAIGKWWELLEDGSYGRRKVYLWPDGISKYRLIGESAEDGTYSIRQSAIEISDGNGKAVIALQPVMIGRDEMRLKGSLNGKELIFILGNANPEAPEIGQESTGDEAEQPQQETDPTESR